MLCHSFHRNDLLYPSHTALRERRDASVTRTDQFSNDYRTCKANLKLFHLVSTLLLFYSASRVTYQSLAMPLKGRDTPADRPRNELEGEEEETAATRNGKISGTISDMLIPLQLDHY